MRLQEGSVHLRHDLCPAPIAGEGQRTEQRSVHWLHRPGKSFWHHWLPSPLGHSGEVWGATKVPGHPITVSCWHGGLCDCGYISISVFSCAGRNETGVCTGYNLFQAAVTLLSRNSLSHDEGVCLQFRLDGNLFNLRRLQAITKTTTKTIHELQYAEDCALLAQSPTAMQHTLDVVCAVYQTSDLQVNIQKTEIIAQTTVPTPTPPEF